MLGPGRSVGAADYIAFIVYAERNAVSAAERSQIDQIAIAVEEGVKGGVAGNVGITNNLALVVDCEGSACSAAECGDLDHPAVGV